jgi:hypothetical protein
MRCIVFYIYIVCLLFSEGILLVVFNVHCIRVRGVFICLFIYFVLVVECISCGLYCLFCVLLECVLGMKSFAEVFFLFHDFLN